MGVGKEGQVDSRPMLVLGILKGKPSRGINICLEPRSRWVTSLSFPRLEGRESEIRSDMGLMPCFVRI